MAHPLAPYRSPEERDSRLDELARSLGAELRVLGRSHEGREIRVARVPRAAATRSASSAPGGSPRHVLVCAGIHGLEYIGSEVALGLLEAMRNPFPSLAQLRSRAEIWVLPSLNPDAYARTWAREGQGELKRLRTNARGVDLNRNFPLPAPQRPVLSTLGGWRTGSDDPANPFYRGSCALSEPETASLDALLRQVPFAASANLHSTWGMMIPPCLERRAHVAAYRTLCRAFGLAQPRSRYRRLSLPALDRFTGEQEDHQHHAFGTWALCIEHYPIWVDVIRFRRADRLFWEFNPPDPAPWIANDVPGIVGFFEAALDLGPPGAHSITARAVSPGG